MDTVETFLLILLVLNAITLGVLVLVQQGQGANVGAAFGSGAASTMFGGRGPGGVLVKATTFLAVGFFAISFGLAYIAKERAAGIDDVGMPQAIEQPVEVPADDRNDGFPDVPDL